VTFSRPTKYLSLLSSIILTQSLTEDHGACLLLLSLPEASISVKNLEIRDESDSRARASQNLTLAIQLMTPALRGLKLKSVEEEEEWTAFYPLDLSIVLGCASKICKSLQVLTLEYPDDQESRVTKAVETQIGSFGSLRELSINPIALSSQLFSLLAALPSLDILECYSIYNSLFISQHGGRLRHLCFRRKDMRASQS
jgi:hypothetical protein